jgi:MgtC family
LKIVSAYREFRWSLLHPTICCSCVQQPYSSFHCRGTRAPRVGLMAFLHSFALPDFLDSLVSLFAAFVLGTLIGAERQYRQRGGGLRTHVLVSVGAATFVDIGMHLNGNAGATQIIVYVVSGVGFLGAGVIMKQGSSVWGLNTAATLWCSAAVGACADAGELNGIVNRLESRAPIENASWELRPTE